jgi:hypothetical protein
MRNKVILLLLALNLALPLQALEKWQLIKEQDDVQVYSTKVQGSRIKSAKGEIIIAASLDDILAVLENITLLPRWLYKCRSAKTIKQADIVERYDYIYTDMPWPSWDRDVIVRSIFQQNPKTKVVTVSFDTDPKMVALKPRVVRVKKMTGRMLLIPQALKPTDNKDSKKTKIIYEVNTDPGGRIPKWLVNDMISDFPFYSLKNLRSLVMTQKRK